MTITILWAGAFMAAGFLCCFFLGRPLIFNIRIASPIIKAMNNTDHGLISDRAEKYARRVNGFCIAVAVIVVLLALYFGEPYMLLGFFIGALAALLVLLLTIKPEKRSMFDRFCMTYFRFVPDDELRTCVYNKKIGKMRHRLMEMQLSDDFIPALED